MTTHKDHKFSITVRTADLAILYCLRSLADYSQETGNTRITWGGTTKDDWKRNGNSVTFRFSRPEYRSGFLSEANKILPKDTWQSISTDDNDPATPR
jgi:hypothetical protein